MKPYIEPIHIKKYAGKRVGIDAYSWLHKGAYSCSMELCLNSDGEKKLRYIDYFMHRINLLRHHKITPVVVFDGGNVPCKSTTEQDRHRRRISNREIAMAKLKEGNVSAATEFFQMWSAYNIVHFLGMTGTAAFDSGHSIVVVSIHGTEVFPVSLSMTGHLATLQFLEGKTFALGVIA
ncbi:hypothetical protein F8388_018853 [Cannabis sativa]|uniref:Exonuclease 1 n=1 Tax=Cannabis sativa TaxID=3483 RepID=A0A7J6FZL9_CANSA|nr:hypothetical protein F8388_018853 [Cannabis sativa]